MPIGLSHYDPRIACISYLLLCHLVLTRENVAWWLGIWKLYYSACNPAVAQMHARYRSVERCLVGNRSRHTLVSISRFFQTLSTRLNSLYVDSYLCVSGHLTMTLFGNFKTWKSEFLAHRRCVWLRVNHGTPGGDEEDASNLHLIYQ